VFASMCSCKNFHDNFSHIPSFHNVFELGIFLHGTYLIKTTKANMHINYKPHTLFGGSRMGLRGLG